MHVLVLETKHYLTRISVVIFDQPTPTLDSCQREELRRIVVFGEDLPRCFLVHAFHTYTVNSDAVLCASAVIDSAKGRRVSFCMISHILFSYLWLVRPVSISSMALRMRSSSCVTRSTTGDTLSIADRISRISTNDHENVGDISGWIRPAKDHDRRPIFRRIPSVADRDHYLHGVRMDSVFISTIRHTNSDKSRESAIDSA